MSKYRQVYFGRWYRIPWRGYKVACCDCGLVHAIDHRRGQGGELFVRYDAAPRHTAAVRRSRQRFVRRKNG